MTERIESRTTSQSIKIDELSRQRALDELAVIGTAPEERFDRVTRLAKHLFGVESVVVTLLDHEREFFKSTAGAVGKAGLRKDAFCDVTMRQRQNLVVPDARVHPLFHANPRVTGEQGAIRFYAGHPLAAPGGERIGALCIFDSEPRDFTETEERVLADLAMWVERELSESDEMKRAAQVQKGLLPKQSLELAGYDIAGGCAPARGVGGDFFDWYETPKGATITLADVMGKGLGAGIIAASVRAVLRTASFHSDVADVVRSAAEILEADLDDAGTFVTLLYARLEAATGVIRYIDAGHGLSLVVRGDGSSERLSTSSLPLGALVGETWSEQTTRLEPGDTLVTVSDGVLDFFDGSLASLDAVRDMAIASPTAQGIIDELLRIASTVALDDTTVVVVRRTAAVD